MPKPILIEYIKDAEKELNFIFPISYVNAMIKENGGSVATEDEDWELYPILDKTDNKSIARTFNNIQRETTESRSWEGFPEEAIAIGDNGCGDRLILLPQKDSIYQWLHESSTVEKVVDSFDELESIF